MCGTKRESLRVVLVIIIILYKDNDDDPPCYLMHICIVSNKKLIITIDFYFIFQWLGLE